MQGRWSRPSAIRSSISSRRSLIDCKMWTALARFVPNALRQPGPSRRSYARSCCPMAGGIEATGFCAFGGGEALQAADPQRSYPPLPTLRHTRRGGTRSFPRIHDRKTERSANPMKGSANTIRCSVVNALSTRRYWNEFILYPGQASGGFAKCRVLQRLLCRNRVAVTIILAQLRHSLAI